ncbi:glycosyltransferase family 4 protein [Atopobacter sp. AH10]|uniref:glycosyltransferase family 4 protein n=1 Tax=Atopobacter sp. AH10 TaxID=2315861 RepID=UPI000EF26DFF|nr:glycosyltransferase family 4 protein [Atopobacter sp. AH10]RLK62922.1 glycosyltransferase family 4 protein [Atopobacter sp. AH10]
MRIGIFTDTYLPQVSGVATSIDVLRAELVKQGHLVYIFTTSDPKAQPDPFVIRFHSVPFVGFKERRIAFSGAVKAIRLAKKFRLDIVHTQTEFSLGLMGRLVARRLRIPMIHTYHTMYERYLHYIFDGKLIKPKHVKELTRFYCDHTNAVVVPSELTKETLLDYGVKQQIFVVPTGVPIPDLDEVKREKVRQRLGYGSDTLVLLALSRLSQEKNTQAIIEQFPAILATEKKARLCIVGDGPDRPNLEKLVAERHLEPFVQFTGEVSHDQASDYYQMADVYINASDSETQGLTYIEALANNLPVIAKRNEYLEHIVQDRTMGVLFNGTNDLARIASQFITEDLEAAKATKDSRMALRQSISSELFGQKIVEIYRYALLNKEWKKRA